MDYLKIFLLVLSFNSFFLQASPCNDALQKVYDKIDLMRGVFKQKNINKIVKISKPSKEEFYPIRKEKKPFVTNLINYFKGFSNAEAIKKIDIREQEMESNKGQIYTKQAFKKSVAKYSENTQSCIGLRGCRLPSDHSYTTNIYSLTYNTVIEYYKSPIKEKKASNKEFLPFKKQKTVEQLIILEDVDAVTEGVQGFLFSYKTKRKALSTLQFFLERTKTYKENLLPYLQKNNIVLTESEIHQISYYWAKYAKPNLVMHSCQVARASIIKLGFDKSNPSELIVYNSLMKLLELTKNEYYNAYQKEKPNNYGERLLSELVLKDFVNKEDLDKYLNKHETVRLIKVKALQSDN